MAHPAETAPDNHFPKGMNSGLVKTSECYRDCSKIYPGLVFHCFHCSMLKFYDAAENDWYCLNCDKMFLIHTSVRPNTFYDGVNNASTMERKAVNVFISIRG
jgi:hypothetical protein